MNLPNILTIARLFMVPLFVVYYVRGVQDAQQYGEIYAAAVFVLAALTDVLDGYIARKYDMITDFGKLADPLADKMMQIAAIGCLALYDRIHSWVFVVLVCKELLLLIGGATILKRFKFVVYSKWSGKVATVVMFLCIVAILVSPASLISQNIGTVMMSICIFFALVALFNYYQMYLRIKENLRQKNEQKE